MAANLYLLPCPNCQHSIELQTRQAGQSISCPQCSTSFDAPRLGELKQLPQKESEDAPSNHSQNSSSQLKRWLFTLGLAFAVLFGCAGAGLYWYAGSIQREVDADTAVASQAADIDNLTDAEVYQVAATINSEDTLGEYFQPAVIKNNKQGEILKFIAYGLLALAGVGLLALIGAFFVK